MTDHDSLLATVRDARMLEVGALQKLGQLQGIYHWHPNAPRVESELLRDARELQRFADAEWGQALLRFLRLVLR